MVRTLKKKLSFIYFFLLGPYLWHISSWAGGQIRAAAAGLHHSHGNAVSDPHLQLKMTLAAMPDP